MLDLVRSSRLAVAACIGLLLFEGPEPAASGWGDWSISIGRGFELVRPYSGEMGVVNADNTVIMTAEDVDLVGPFLGYAWTESHLIIKAYNGERNIRYLIVSENARYPSGVSGPWDEELFNQQLALLGYTKPQTWHRTEPLWRPMLIATCYATPFLGVLGMILIVRFVTRSKSNRGPVRTSIE